MKHLLYLKDLNQETINQILDTADNFLDHDNQPIGSEGLLKDKTIANPFCLFFIIKMTLPQDFWYSLIQSLSLLNIYLF